MQNIIRRALFCALFLFLLTTAVNAADLTGKWSGGGELKTANGDTRDTTAYLEIQQKGEEVTGSAGPDAGQLLPISKGKLSGTKLTFEVVQSGGSGDVLYTFEFTVTGDKMEGTVKSARFSGTLTLKRS